MLAKLRFAIANADAGAPALEILDNVADIRPQELRFGDGTQRLNLYAVGAVLAEATCLSASGQPVFLPLKSVVRASSASELVLSPDAEHAGIAAFAPLVELTADAVIERVREAGIAGMGGAGFPTWRKLALVDAEQPWLLLVNAVECEPGCMADRVLLRQALKSVTEGIRLLAEAFSLVRTVVAIKSTSTPANMPDQSAASLTKLLATQGYATVIAPAHYPAGDERMLCAQLGYTLAAGQRPSDHRVLVLNVATVAAIGAAVARGQAPAERLLTLHGGAIGVRQVLRVPLGALLVDVVALACAEEKHRGGRPTQPKLDVQVGGAMMARDLDVHGPVVKQATTALWVNERRTNALVRPCINCGRCDPVCPQFLPVARLYAVIEAGQGSNQVAHLQADQLGIEQLGVQDCSGCRCCDVVCPSHIPLAAVLREARASSIQEHAVKQLAERAKLRSEAHAERQRQRDAKRSTKLRQRGDGRELTKAKLDSVLRAARRRRERPDVS